MAALALPVAVFEGSRLVNTYSEWKGAIPMVRVIGLSPRPEHGRDLSPRSFEHRAATRTHIHPPPTHAAAAAAPSPPHTHTHLPSNTPHQVVLSGGLASLLNLVVFKLIGLTSALTT
jgi:hypothetical protein